METSVQGQAFQADWLSKTLAGTLLGLALAYVSIALFAWYVQEASMLKTKYNLICG
ncbi:hypothetical protein [Pseudoalteromonas xiamenensis]